MFTPKLLLFLAAGTLFMFVPVLIQSRWYDVKWYKALLLTVILTVAGTLSTMIHCFVEVGEFSGISFYGAVFYVPVMFLLVAKVLRLPYGTAMDLCAPAECAMLVIMKVHCLISGCCGGRVMCVAGNTFVFPSQYVEMANAVILMLILLLMSRKGKNRGSLYPWYMVLYGCSRFVLNMFRETKIFALGMSAGCVWSVWSVLLGTAVLVLWRRKKKQEASNS